MFETLGLDERALRVYRMLLLHPAWSLDELAQSLELDADTVRTALDVLMQRSLLAESQVDSDRWRTVSPDVAMRGLLASLERELGLRQEELGRLRAEVASFTDEYHQARPVSHDPLEQLDGRDAVVARLAELNLAARTEILAFVTNRPSRQALEQAREHDADLLARGLAVRNLYLESVRYDARVVAYLEWLESQGAQVRTTPTLPVRLVVHDRATAVVAKDAEDPAQGAVLVCGGGLLTALVSLFERCWDAASGLSQPVTAAPETLPRTERELLRLMARGSKDEALARQLGVSVRTVRRMIADLSVQTGADSRFELAVHAVRRGWL